MSYIQSHKNQAVCVFCSEAEKPDNPENLIVRRGQRAFVILNRYPYTSGHLLIVPYEHQPTLDLLDIETRSELMEMVNEGIQVLESVYKPQGYNVGINIGELAGAGITGHIHMHVVPRWGGDTNFMSSLGNTRVLPESLEDSYRRLAEAWKQKTRTGD
jgi:ATP adenylyltransferase